MHILFRCLLPLAMAAYVEAAAMRAGVAKVDIKPETHEVMWGFEDRLTPASGILDPLFARVLVLDNGRTRLGIVVLDLGRSFGRESLNQLRRHRGRQPVSLIGWSRPHTRRALR